MDTATMTIRIRGDGLIAAISSPPPEVLAELTVDRRRFRPDGRGGLRPEAEPEPLFYDAADGSLILPPGLVHPVATVGRRAGYRVEIEGPAGPVSGMPTPELPADLDDARRPLATSLTTARGGVIPVDCDRDRLDAIELMPRIFPGQSIAIVAKTRREARTIQPRQEIEGAGRFLDERR